MLIYHAAGLYGMKVDIIRIYQTEAEWRRCEAEVQQSIENGHRKSEKLEKRNNPVYNNRCVCNAETQYSSFTYVLEFPPNPCRNSGRHRLRQNVMTTRRESNQAILLLLD